MRTETKKARRKKRDKARKIMSSPHSTWYEKYHAKQLYLRTIKQYHPFTRSKF